MSAVDDSIAKLNQNIATLASNVTTLIGALEDPANWTVGEFRFVMRRIEEAHDNQC